MIRRASRKVATVVLSAGLAIGLGACSSGESAPQPTNPNGTLQQVLHNLGGTALGKLTPGQTFSFVVGGEKVDLYNLTPTQIDERQFKAGIKYLRSVAIRATSYNMTINPHGTQQPQDVSVFTQPRSAAEHDFVIVPAGTDMPPAMGGAAAATVDLDAQSQEISVVPFDQSPDGIFTEECQSFVAATEGHTTGASDDPGQLALNRILEQETVCNGLGEAMTAAASGLPPQDYLKERAGDVGRTIANGLGTFVITGFSVDQTQYSAMQHALL